MVTAPPLRLLRGILKELRSQSPGRFYCNSTAYKYIMDQFRKKQFTSEKRCRAQQELYHQDSTYMCLLQSVRQHLALHQEYHSKGEQHSLSDSNCHSNLEAEDGKSEKE